MRWWKSSYRWQQKSWSKLLKGTGKDCSPGAGRERGGMLRVWYLAKAIWADPLQVKICFLGDMADYGHLTGKGWYCRDILLVVLWNSFHPVNLLLSVFCNWKRRAIWAWMRGLCLKYSSKRYVFLVGLLEAIQSLLDSLSWKCMWLWGMESPWQGTCSS